MGLSFITAASPRQRSHSRVRVPRKSEPYFTVSDSRPSQPRGPGLRIYIPQEQGGPDIPFSPPLMTRRAAVDVFESASTLCTVSPQLSSS
jgi:hypothetical protein